MKKWWFTGFFILFFCSLFLTFPADRMLPRLMPEGVIIERSDGNLSHGSAERLIVDDIIASDVRWQLQPLSLLLLKLKYHGELLVKNTPVRVSVTINPFIRSVYIEQIEADIVLASFIPDAEIAGVRGPVLIELEDANLSSFNCADFSGVMYLGSLTTKLPDLPTLDQQVGEVRCVDDSLQTEFQLVGDQLKGAVRASVDAEENYSLSLKLASANSELHGLLSSFLGEADKKGFINAEFNGVLNN